MTGKPASVASRTHGGPEPKYVKGRDGYPIVGLSRHKPSGRYYATHSKSRKYFGTDLDLAVLRFRRWQGQQYGERPAKDAGIDFNRRNIVSSSSRPHQPER